MLNVIQDAWWWCSDRFSAIETGFFIKQKLFLGIARNIHSFFVIRMLIS
jgi:hypothetical protein